MKYGRKKKEYPLKERKARLWHASLRLWIWKWQTLAPMQRGVLFYYSHNFPRPPRPTFIKSGDVYNRHRIFSVSTIVWVQKDVSVKIPSGLMRCERCKIMGSISTFEEYHCS